GKPAVRNPRGTMETSASFEAWSASSSYLTTNESVRTRQMRAREARLSQSSQACAHFAHECCGLLECREMTSLVEFVEVNELGEAFFTPAARRAEYLLGEYRAPRRHRYWLNLHGAEALPVKAC